MSDDKTTAKNQDEVVEKDPKKTTDDEAVTKKDEKDDVDEIDLTKSSKEEVNGIKGLEELPEEIRIKLEKKKAENAKKSKAKKKKKKILKQITSGKAFVKATYNNTIVTLTDLNGNVISWASAGVAGFKGPKKSTPYAAQIITRIAVGKAREIGLEEVSVFVKGVGSGRESAVRALNSNGLNVTSIKDITPVPHNGCRARKPRRV
jgi:small subunit ribosomal protein S11